MKPVWMEMGIPEERWNVLVKEATSITKTNEPVVTQIRFVQNSKVPQTQDERDWLIYSIAKNALEVGMLKQVPAGLRESLAAMLGRK